MVQFLYLFHLLIPVLVLYDAVEAYQSGFRGKASHALVVLGAVWLLGGLALWMLRKRPRVKQWIPNITLTVITVFVSFILAESAISMMFPAFRTGLNRTPRPPNLTVELVKNPLAVPGQELNTFVKTNELGMRGPSLKDKDGAFRILAIGGSTTECFALDEQNTWPYLLMRHLENAHHGRVWLQNSGVSGHTSTDHFYMLRTNPVVPEADLIVILVGINDLTATLAFEGRSAESDLERQAREEFSVFPRYTRSATYKLLKFLSEGRTELRYDHTNFYEQMRQKRRNAPLLPAPDLRQGIEEYRERIRRLTEECKRIGKRCILLTQPTLWKSNLSAEESAAIWLGYLGPIEKPIGYLSPRDLQQGMDAFNRSLLEVAQTEGVEAFDLAAHVPKSLAHFYDDAHFTNEGARVVAEQVASYVSGRFITN